MRYVVAYDISDDATRERLATNLLQHGIRLQFSVFECELTKPQRDEVVAFAERIVDVISDSVMVLPTCERCAEATIDIGAVPSTLDEPYYII